MARHGRAGKNAIPPGNMPGKAAAAAPMEKVEEVAAEGATKARGRTAKTNVVGPQPSAPLTPQVMRREADRPMSAGVKKRGDRRDTHPDPGRRGNGLNRSIRQGPTRATAGKAAIGGKRADNSRSRGGSGK